MVFSLSCLCVCAKCASSHFCGWFSSCASFEWPLVHKENPRSVVSAIPPKSKEACQHSRLRLFTCARKRLLLFCFLDRGCKERQLVGAHTAPNNGASPKKRTSKKFIAQDNESLFYSCFSEMLIFLDPLNCDKANIDNFEDFIAFNGTNNNI